MNNDQTFRAVLIVVFLLVLPIGIYHRLKSQATRERLDRRQEGLFILATLRPIGAAFWLGLIAWTVGFGVNVYLTGIWLSGSQPIGQRPLLAFGVLTMLVDPLSSSYPTPEKLQQFFDQVEAEVRTVPGVQDVAWSSALPLGDSLYGDFALTYEIVGKTV